MCLHSDSEAFVGQTYLKQEKKGEGGTGFVLCHKKKRSPVTCYRMMNIQPGFVFRVTNRNVNQSAGVQRRATHAEKCAEIMRDFFCFFLKALTTLHDSSMTVQQQMFTCSVEFSLSCGQITKMAQL